MPGLILAAPASGSGKTTVSLGLLRAFRDRNVAARGAKSGPDYIDPRFHEAACGLPSVNLDAWAMKPDRLRSLAAGKELLLVEGAMGLFDGAPPDGKGSTADLSRHLGIPAALVVDAARMAHSVAPLVAGFAAQDRDVRVAGIVLNRVGSPRHESMLVRALEPLGIPVLGALPRQKDLSQPSRHLGLVQASERPDLEDFIRRAAEIMARHVDLDALAGLAAPPRPPAGGPKVPVRPPAQRIALARDEAFAFAYPHLLADWRAAGAEILPFSPLADEPAPPADLVYLPGGYPELHAGRLARAARFMDSLRETAGRGVAVYGECGGYMALGESLVDADGAAHRMAGLLPLTTSFAEPRLHLGYRTARALGGPFPGVHAAHEFHYAATLRSKGPALFDVWNAEGDRMPPVGLISGSASGSFLHLIEAVE